MSWPRFFGQNTGERAGVIAAITGVLALLVAIISLFISDGKPPDDKPLDDGSSSITTSGKNIPEDYIGTWKGQVEMKLPTSGGEKGIDEIIIKRGKVGDVVAEQRAVDWVDSSGQKTGCSHSWELSEVEDGQIMLKESSTETSDNLQAGDLCLSDLTMKVRIADHETIGIQADTDILAVKINAFIGTLKRQS